MIDKSGSMAAKASDKDEPKNGSGTAGMPKDWIPGPALKDLPPAEQGVYPKCKQVFEKWKKFKVTKRMDGVKKALIKAVYFLDPKVHFTVIMYDDLPRPWKGGEVLFPATWQNKFIILDQVDRTVEGGGTNYWDTFMMGFKYVEKAGVIAKDDKKNYAYSVNGADTFFFLSDGEPTVGPFTESGKSQKSELLAELRKVNLLRKIVVHTICIGDEDPNDPRMGVDPKFLQKIADENGGIFKHITDD
jgi:hypothetical protein